MSKLKKAMERAKEARHGNSTARSRNKRNVSKLKKALNRAKDDRRDNIPVISEVEDKSLQPKREIVVPQKLAEEIRFSYSTTKVIDIDPFDLRQNKIISHIKEDKISDQISVLKTQLLTKLENIDGNTLMVTSALPGEGKTFMSINLGVSIAQELNRSVLLVDCDLRHQEKTHVDFSADFLGIKIQKGLSDILLGQAQLEDVLINPSIDRLTILPAGKPIMNSSELIASTRMEMLVAEVKRRYGKNRIVIFDSPSILKISDPLIFSRFVDGVLLVVEANKSSAADIKKAMGLLKDRVILGMVLNKVRSK